MYIIKYVNLVTLLLKPTINKQNQFLHIADELCHKFFCSNAELFLHGCLIFIVFCLGNFLFCPQPKQLEDY